MQILWSTLPVKNPFVFVVTGAEAGLTGEDAMFEYAELTAFSTVTVDGSTNPLSYFISRGGIIALIVLEKENYITHSLYQ